MTAVAPVVIDCQGVWVGWTGISDFSESDSIPESPPDDPSPTSGTSRRTFTYNSMTMRRKSSVLSSDGLLPMDSISSQTFFILKGLI